MPGVSRDHHDAYQDAHHDAQPAPAATEAPRPGRGAKSTQSESLIGYAEGAELFHDPGGEVYATVKVDDHLETWPIRGGRFRQWILRHHYLSTGKAPGAQALADALATISARAAFDGAERAVSTRVAKHGGAVYVDLCNGPWEAVEVSRSGWRVLPSEALPVRFVRKDNAAALPRPVPGGTVDLLRPFTNVATEEHFRLLVAWLVGAFNPDGPYPLLVLQGEQGSAKSTTVRVARSVTDPAVEPLRAPPRDERDLAIAASGNWTPALDNLSGVRPWLSDALCRLATGGGFATRELFSDDREVVFSQKRPVILNGIDTLAVAGDLRDRSLVIELPPIPPEKKLTERRFYRGLEAVRSPVLGALLGAASAALRNLDLVELEELPRMADFAVWVAAAEESLPWESGAFLGAYAGNRAEASTDALDTDPVAVAVCELMDGREEWTGTATDLYAALAELVDEDVRRRRVWPSAANSLSNRIKRIAPSLREAGIEYADERSPGGKRTRKKSLKRLQEGNRPGRPDRPAREGGLVAAAGDDGTPGRDTRDGRDDQRRGQPGRERFVL